MIDPNTGLQVEVGGVKQFHKCAESGYKSSLLGPSAPADKMVMLGNATHPGDVSATLQGKIPSDEAIGAALAFICQNNYAGIDTYWSYLAANPSAAMMNPMIASQRGTITAVCNGMFTGASVATPALPCQPVTGVLNFGALGAACCNAASVRAAGTLASMLKTKTALNGAGVNRCHAETSDPAGTAVTLYSLIIRMVPN